MGELRWCYYCIGFKERSIIVKTQHIFNLVCKEIWYKGLHDVKHVTWEMVGLLFDTRVYCDHFYNTCLLWAVKSAVNNSRPQMSIIVFIFLKTQLKYLKMAIVRSINRFIFLLFCKVHFIFIFSYLFSCCLKMWSKSQQIWKFETSTIGVYCYARLTI